MKFRNRSAANVWPRASFALSEMEKNYWSNPTLYDTGHVPCALSKGSSLITTPSTEAAELPNWVLQAYSNSSPRIKSALAPPKPMTHAYKSNYSSTMGPPRCAHWDTTMMGSLSTATPACTAARPPPSPSPRQAQTDQFHWRRTFYVPMGDFSLGIQDDTGCQIPISPPNCYTLHVLLRDLLQG